MVRIRNRLLLNRLGEWEAVKSVPFLFSIHNHFHENRTFAIAEHLIFLQLASFHHISGVLG